MVSEKEHLRVVVVREGGVHIAQCVDFDITGQGENAEAAMDNLWDELLRHILVSRKTGRPPFEGVGPPPQRYVELWEQGRTSGIRLYDPPDSHFKGGSPDHVAGVPTELQYACVA